MKIHLICPFYRKHLLLTLIHYLEPMNIEWHPVCDFVDIEAFKETDPAWIHPILCKPLRIPGDTSFRKLNDYIDSFGIGKYDYLVWLEALERQANLDKNFASSASILKYIKLCKDRDIDKGIIDEDYYGFMGDDDMYEDGFFDAIRQQTSKIVYVSLSRGNATPTNDPKAAPHPTFPLIIKGLDNVKVCAIGLPQYFMKGSILKQMRFNNTKNCDDGYFAEELAKRWPNDLKFLPEYFAFGNFFEPGRYTNNNWKLKPNWELPKLIEVTKAKEIKKEEVEVPKEVIEMRNSLK